MPAGWVGAGSALAVAGAVVLLSPLRTLVTENDVPVWLLGVVLLAVGAWFVVYALLSRPRRAGAASLSREASSMPHDPAIYDPADYEPRAGYVTDVSGRTNTTPLTVVIAVVAGWVTLLVSGLLQVDRWVAYGFGVVAAVVVAQLWSLSGQRRRG